MDAESHHHSLAPKPRGGSRRWNYEEETRLLHLIQVEHITHEQAGIAMNRTTQSVAQRMSLIQQRDESASITWTPELDAAIINGRRRGLTPTQFAQELKISYKAIQARWLALKVLKKVPEDVLALRRRESLRDFTPEEDEVILRWYVAGKDDKEIAVLANIEDKSATEIIERRRKLVSESSPIYRRLIGEQQDTWKGDDDKEKMDALGLSVGRGKYEWMTGGDTGGDAALE